MIHVLVIQLYVVLGGDVVRQIVIHNETQQPVQQRQIYLFIDLRQLGLNHDITLPICSFPNPAKVIDTLSPLVCEQGRYFRI